MRSAAGCRGLVVLFSHRYPDHMDVQVDVAEIEVHLSELLARIEAGHKDIAFEFASWVSPYFKLYLIKEFERLAVDRKSVV